MAKKRTIPQLQAMALSGDSALLCVDRTTLGCIVRLWGVTLYPNTFTLDGQEPDELSSSARATLLEHRRAILDDFERGIAMSCDITSALELIASKLDALDEINNNVRLAISSSCCAESGGAGGYGEGIGDMEPAPPTPEQANKLCRAVNYARDLAVGWFESVIEPMFSSTLEAFGATIIALLATPPYSTTLLELAGGLTGALAFMGASALSGKMSEVIDYIFDNVYCELFEGEESVTWESWVMSVADELCDSYASVVGAAVIWFINKSGAGVVLRDYVDAVVPSLYDDTCPTCYEEGDNYHYIQYSDYLHTEYSELCGINLRWTCIDFSGQTEYTEEFIELDNIPENVSSVRIQLAFQGDYFIGITIASLFVNGDFDVSPIAEKAHKRATCGADNQFDVYANNLQNVSRLTLRVRVHSTSPDRCVGYGIAGVQYNV